MSLTRKTKKRNKFKKGKGTQITLHNSKDISPLRKKEKELKKAEKKRQKEELKKYNKTNKKGFFNRLRHAFTRNKFSPIEVEIKKPIMKKNILPNYQQNYQQNSNSSEKKIKELANKLPKNVIGFNKTHGYIYDT